MKLITISGLPGSGSTTTAKLLANRLNLDYFNVGQLFKDISRGTYKKQFYYKKFKKLCDQSKLIIPEFSEDDDSHGATNLWQTDFGKSKELHNVLDELQRTLAENGNIIIDGKLSLYIIPKSNAKIWLKASVHERAKRSAKRDNITEEKAKELLEKRQESQSVEWNKIYGINSHDQEKLADIIIDTTNLTPEQVLEKILKRIIFQKTRQ